MPERPARQSGYEAARLRVRERWLLVSSPVVEHSLLHARVANPGASKI